MALIMKDTGIVANRFEADAVAKQHSGRLPKHAELEGYSMERGFWVREWAAKSVLIERGNDLVDEKTGVRVEAKDVQKMLELKKALEEKLGMKIPIEKLLYLLDPEGFELKNGLYVHQNPKITVVQNAVLEMGGKGIADPETKIAVYAAEIVLVSLSDNEVKWNYIKDGVVPLARKDFSCYGFDIRRAVVGIHPSNFPERILSVTESSND